MHKWLILLFVLFLAHGAQAQAPPARTLPQLQDYQGLYEYVNHTTLQLAASPRDLVLYAIIAESRYPLHVIGPDVFGNQGRDTVRFQRDGSGKVTSFTVQHQLYHLLKRNLIFPPQMWYPRLPDAAHPFPHPHAPPPPPPPAPPPPTADGLPVGPLQGTGLDPALLAALTTKIVDGTYPNVHSVLIIKDGRLVFEEYFFEYTRDKLHPLRSATKSFVSALTGIAVQQGVIRSVREPVAPFFPEYALQNNSADKQKISVEDLLTNQSGLDCDIANNKSAGNETTMDYSRDWVKFTLDLPMLDAPGSTGRYCSGNPVTLGRIIEKQARLPLADFARKTLFAPLGITQFDWRFQPDSSSAETYCQLSLRPRDMAKFGLLYLDNGQWQGRQVVPAAWVSASFAKHSVVQNVDYGYLWWEKHLDVAGVRYHGVAAQGNGGQRIFVWPEQHMVTVITGGNYNQQSPSDELIGKYILAAFNKK